MKLIHLSDLHLGKRVNEYSMMEDQIYILKQITGMIDEEKPDGVLIAGDIYDKPVPPAEAVQVFDHFLTEISERNIPVFVISGNHDSAERVAFGGRLMEKSGVYMAPVYNGCVTPVELKDEYGSVFIYMLPFLKPAAVRKYWPDDAIETFDDALRCAVGHITGEGFNRYARNVILSHQFVMGASSCDSEERSIGGLDQVSAEIFAPFDYTALGHIHGPQKIGTDRVRYSGTPLKYSFSEARHKKSVTIVELFEKGKMSVSTREMTPLHDLRELYGTYEELTKRENYQGTAVDDYLHITLTDEEDILDAIGKLRTIYPNIMKLDYDNVRTRTSTVLEPVREKKYSPIELLEQLYERQNNQPMGERQREFAESIIREIWEDKT